MTIVPYCDENALPGIRRDSAGRLMFELTPEEQHDVKFFLGPDKDKDLWVRSEYVELLPKSLTAFALVRYARDQVRLAGECGATERKDILHKALAAVAKAGTLSELPIYEFDLACVFEFLGEREIAIEGFRRFLSRYDQFVPTVVDGVALKERKALMALTIAKGKLT